VRGLTSSISDPVVSQSTETLTPKAPVYPSPRASDPGPKRDDGKKREGKKEKKEKKEKKHKSPSRPT
jgi:hypothetical protein